MRRAFEAQEKIQGARKNPGVEKPSIISKSPRQYQLFSSKDCSKEKIFAGY
jgi:hypothetical protein